MPLDGDDIITNNYYARGFAIDRLAAYEDTGLTPEELMNIKENGIIPEHWRELFIAEAGGRLVVLPCKVGTPIWRTHKVFGEASISEETFKLPDLPQYGKTVFLTREEAERSLVHETD